MKTTSSTPRPSPASPTAWAWGWNASWAASAASPTKPAMRTRWSTPTPPRPRTFLERTGADFLAVSIGTQHGVYKAEPHLDIPRLQEIRAAVDAPLVLHGGSGLSDDDFRNTISGGIAKINVYTDIILAGKRALAEHPEASYTDGICHGAGGHEGSDAEKTARLRQRGQGVRENGQSGRSRAVRFCVTGAPPHPQTAFPPSPRSPRRRARGRRSCRFVRGSARSSPPPRAAPLRGGSRRCRRR